MSKIDEILEIVKGGVAKKEEKKSRSRCTH